MTTTHTPTATHSSLAGARAWFAEKGLSRRRGHRMIGGVAGAYARRYEIDPLVARISALAIAIAFTPLAYIAMWVMMPYEE